MLQKNIFAQFFMILGEGHTRLRERGWGPNSSQGERHCSTLSTVYVLCCVHCPQTIGRDIQNNSRLYQTKTQRKSRRYMTFAAHTIICCKYYSFFVLLSVKSKTLRTRWQPIIMTKKHPAPPPALTYNG